MHSIHSSFIRSGTALRRVGAGPRRSRTGPGHSPPGGGVFGRHGMPANASQGRALDALASLPLNFEPRELGGAAAFVGRGQGYNISVGARGASLALLTAGRRAERRLCDRRRDRRCAPRGRDAPARRDAPLRRRPAGLAGQRRDLRARRRPRRPARHRRRLLRRPAAARVRLHRQARRRTLPTPGCWCTALTVCRSTRRRATCSCTWPGRCCASARRLPTRRSTASAGRSRVHSRSTPRSGRVGFEVGALRHRACPGHRPGPRVLDVVRWRERGGDPRMKVDANGFIYVLGSSEDNGRLPDDAWRAASRSGLGRRRPAACTRSDYFVSKFNPAGSALVYSTLLRRVRRRGDLALEYIAGRARRRCAGSRPRRRRHDRRPTSRSLPMPPTPTFGIEVGEPAGRRVLHPPERRRRRSATRPTSAVPVVRPRPASTSTPRATPTWSARRRPTARPKAS